MYVGLFNLVRGYFFDIALPIEVLFLYLSAQANAQVTQCGLALNPLKKNELEDIFHYRLAWQSSISPEQYEQRKDGITRRFTNPIKMCELPEVKTLFKENAYLNQ